MQINGFFWGYAVTQQPKSPLLVGLALLISAECVLMCIATVYLLVGMFGGGVDSLPSAIALAVLTTVAAVWLGFMAVGVLRGRPWVRGAVITWQVLQIAVAIGCFQGYFARPDLGWLLLVPSLVAVLLLFTPPVVEATTEPR